MFMELLPYLIATAACSLVVVAILLHAYVIWLQRENARLSKCLRNRQNTGSLR
jgi:uncharacterized iron-regulated membrane protein